jgi:hypothetical protein
MKLVLVAEFDFAGMSFSAQHRLREELQGRAKSLEIAFGPCQCKVPGKAIVNRVLLGADRAASRQSFSLIDRDGCERRWCDWASGVALRLEGALAGCSQRSVTPCRSSRVYSRVSLVHLHAYHMVTSKQVDTRLRQQRAHHEHCTSHEAVSL